MTKRRRADWLDEDEFPDEDDEAAFGDDSPPDDDRLTMGRIRGVPAPFWTRGRIVLAVVIVILIISLLLPQLLPLLR